MEMSAEIPSFVWNVQGPQATHEAGAEQAAGRAVEGAVREDTSREEKVHVGIYRDFGF